MLQSKQIKHELDPHDGQRRVFGVHRAGFHIGKPGGCNDTQQ